MTREDLYQAQLALLDAISAQTRYFLDQVDEVRSMPAPGVVADDVQNSRRELDSLWRALDAIGWPSPTYSREVA